MNEVVYHFWERNASDFAKIVNIGSNEVNTYMMCIVAYAPINITRGI